MTKTFKKIAASVMAAATLAVGTVGMTASANSSFNNINSFSVNPGTGSYRYLPPTYPSKDTTNPVYVYLSSASFSVQTRVMGCSSSNGSVGNNCTLNASGQRVDSIQVSPRVAAYIKNNVRDNYNYCTLGFLSSSSYGGTSITGQWVSY